MIAIDRSTGDLLMLKQFVSFLNIPYIQKEQEQKYYGYLLSGNLIRGFFLLGVITIVASLFVTYFISYFKKSGEAHYLISAIVSISLMFFIFIYFNILKKYKNKPDKHTKKAYIILTLIQNCVIITTSMYISFLEDNLFVLFSFITLVTIIIFLTPFLIIIQYTLTTFIYILMMLNLFEYRANELFTALLVIFVSSIISYAVYINKLTEFQLLIRIKEKNTVLKEYNKELSEYSFSDALTGVNNRRRIEDLLRKEWKSCKASYHNLSIIFIDIDNFKKYNDYYGHVEGDACLIKVATAIEELCVKLPKNKNCSMGRYGGEEFIIILPKADKEYALAFAKKVTEKIHNLNIPHIENDNHPFVTISCGVTTMVPDEHKRILYILESADQALYHVKRNGKNNAMHFSDLILEG